jgi:alpha-L-rhamnosidase
VIRCTDLRTERLADPIGLDGPAPRLTWRLEATDGERDVQQLAAQVEVEGGWDSGRIDGWRQQLAYAGPALRSRAAYRWRVRAWTSAGESDWSAWATFELGVLDGWSATMIAVRADTAVRFATTVDVPADVVSARLRATAHGVFVAEVDGVVVGDEVLAPGWTSYANRLHVRSSDVTGLVAAATSVEVALVVAPGWFRGRGGFVGKRGLSGDHVGAFAPLELEGADGSLVVVGTDDSWSASTTAWRAADLYDGETFDADTTVCEPLAVSVVDGFDPAVLVAPVVPPVRRTETIRPVSSNGNVVDFGQNLVGWLRLTLRGVPAGTEVVLRHAEVLTPDGALYTEPLRTAKATDTYVARGDAEERYEPRFTFHGFRYAEVTGIDLSAVGLEAVVVHTDLERTGTFACSDPLIERLHENVRWGQRGNFVSVPTDCPQRDERLGWTGDAQVFAPTASYLYDCETFWESWLADLEADQRDDGRVPHVIPDILFNGGACGWGDAAVTIPWSTYVAYGDDTVLRRSMRSMRAWVDYVHSRLEADHRWLQDFQFGDWLDPDAPVEKPFKAKARFDLVASAYAAHVTGLLGRACAVVGERGAADDHSSRATEMRSAWWANYGEAAARTQTGAALGIAFGLAPDEAATAELGDALALRVHEAGDHLATGFLGTPLLLSALTTTGHLDVAYAVLLQRTPPSWLYTVLAGGTTIWERWDALRPDGSVPMGSLTNGTSMVSWNHYAYGAVAEWLPTTVAGLRVDPDAPGYRHFFVEPHPGGGLSSAATSLATRFGRAAVSWRIESPEEPTLHVEVEVPPNTSATVSLPGAPSVVVGSGSHSFSS